MSPTAHPHVLRSPALPCPIPSQHCSASCSCPPLPISPGSRRPLRPPHLCTPAPSVPRPPCRALPDTAPGPVVPRARHAAPPLRSPARGHSGAALCRRAPVAGRGWGRRGERGERGAEGGAGSGFSRSLRAEPAPTRRLPPSAPRGDRGTGAAAAPGGRLAGAPGRPWHRRASERGGNRSGQRYRSDRGTGAPGHQSGCGTSWRGRIVRDVSAASAGRTV